MRHEIVTEAETPAFAARGVKTLVLLGADMLAAIIAFLGALFASNLLRVAVGLEPIAMGSDGFRLHLVIVGALTGALFIWFHSRGHYRRRQALADQLGPILGGAVIATLAAATIQFATIEVGSRLLTMTYWLLLAPGLILIRLLARQTLRAANAWSRPAVLFTCSTRASELVSFINKREEMGVQVVSALALDGLGVNDVLEEMRQAAARRLTIIYSPSHRDAEQVRVVESLVLEGLPFVLSPQIGPLPNHAEILEFPPEDISLIEVHDPLARPVARLIKRAFDVMVAALALAFLSPLLIPLTLAIRMDGGPALFRQKRVGKDGEIFGCLKFRSMVLDAEGVLETMIATDPAIAAEWKAYQKLKKDPRITAVGRLIRKTNLDELPQLVNVLRGEMSLVGPRPMTEPQISEYGPQFTAYTRMRPGITGLWQTNGRNATTFTERARLDAWYVRNWSLWRDFVILVRTVREVIFARGN